MNQKDKMKTISLTQNQSTKVSDEWYEILTKWSWYARLDKHTNTYYAVRDEWNGGRKKHILMHRVVAKPPDNKKVDHRDGDTLNNLPENLRICTNQQNQHNQKISNKNMSGYKGVSKGVNGKWRASIKFNNKSINLKNWETPEDAARAYDDAAKKYFGEFARLNFP